MNANTFFIVLLVGLFIGSLALHAASIRFGLKWMRIAEVSLLKALGLFLVFYFAGMLAAALLVALLYATSIDLSDPIWNISAYLLQFFVSGVVVSRIYKVKWATALKSLVPHALLSAVIFVVIIFGFRPFAYEAFSIPTNGMAPTILGNHWESPCPRCGAVAYGAPLDPAMPPPSSGFKMICSKEKQTVFVAGPPTESQGGDRILVCKLLKPRRWDLLVFRYPGDPAEIYVKRLVGLPGEKLAIRDGAIWINDAKIDPPASLAGIRYSPTIEWDGQPQSGPGSQPVELGQDEYFVLGDFVDLSSDSRFWEQGAPGHPPYAVPESHIVGVAINIYWPIHRWTSFR
jgi:signal peptidase I